MKNLRKNKFSRHEKFLAPFPRFRFLLIFGLFLALYFPLSAHAWFGLDDITYWAISKVVFGISYIISFLFGIVIIIETWFVQILLEINAHILESAPVKFGFPVTLSIANFGFVLGIVVIAIMTILRSETYGVKQILWKLVVMAVLINFSLVIAGVILGLSDSFSSYFLKGIDPSEAGISSFASRLAGAFNPQKSFFSTAGLEDPEAIADSLDVGGAGEIAGVFGGEIGKLAAPLAGLIFSILAIWMIGLTLGVLIVMLVVRYVALGILLVVMPFAWMLWVFPTFKSNWDKWWHQFLRWAFFSPIVLFFLWLGMQTSGAISNKAEGYDFAIYKSDSNDVWATISSILTGFFTPIVENLMQAIIIVGVMLGGLIAANKLSVFGAHAAVNGAKGVASWAGGKAVQYGSAPLRRRAKEGPYKGMTTAERMTAKAQEKGRGAFGRVGYGLLGRGFARLETAGGEQQVEKHEQWARQQSTEVLAADYVNSVGARRIGIGNELTNRKRLDKLELGSVVGQKEKDLRERFGDDQRIFHKENVEPTTGTDTATYEAYQKFKAAKAGGASPEETKKLKEAAETAADAFAARLKNKHISMMQANDFYGGKPGDFGPEGVELGLRELVIGGLARSGPERLPYMVGGMKSKVLNDEFGPLVAKAFEREIEKLKTFTTSPSFNGLPENEKNPIIRKLEKLEKSQKGFQNSLDNALLGFTPEAASSSSASRGAAAGQAAPGH